MKIKLLPRQSSIAHDNGIGRVVYAQYKHLPAFGIEFTDNANEADLLIGHTQQFDLPRMDVLHLHGMYWLGDLNSGLYGQYNLQANAAIIQAVRRAYAVTVPSAWVALPFKRDMRIDPIVIGHGIDFAEWQIGQPQGYALWAKNRNMDVCQPIAAYELAKRGIEVMTTFAPDGVQIPHTLQVIGRQESDAMKQILAGADVYLATVKETFGIQTLEAMACGVPVIGWDYGGTAEIVTNGYDGILVRPGDYDALYEAYRAVMQKRDEMSDHARETASLYDWRDVMRHYAELYERVAEDRKRERRGVSVVITNYNYGRYVGRAVESCLNQTQKPDEIIVVDDGSTDNSLDELARFRREIKVITQDNQGVAAARTTGIEAAQQEHIILLDADDMLAETFVETLHKPLLDDRGLGIAYTGLLAVADNGSVIGTDFPPAFDWEKQAAVSNPPSCCVPSCCMFRKEMWRRAGPHKQEYAPGEDAEFWTRGLSVGFDALKVTDEKLFIYRVHEASASRKLRYRPIDDRLPWMRDKRYPLAAPSKYAPLIKSYSEPKVSVLVNVPAGAARHVPQLIDSLLGQTMREWEVIVYGLDAEYIPRYPFIRFTADRAIALEKAQADLVIFLEADDMLTNSALEDMCIAHVQSGGKAIYPDAINTQGQSVGSASIALLPTEWARKYEVANWRTFYAALRVDGHCMQHLGRAVLISNRPQAEMIHEGADMACCGGSGNALLAAKQALEGMMASPVEPGRVRLEYIGVNIGAISFFGKSGMEYRGGNNDFEKFADVAEEDVPRLISTGRWRQAITPAPVVTETPVAVKAVETPTPQLEAVEVDVAVPEVIEVTAEDEAINKMIEQSRKQVQQTSKKGKK